MALAVCHNITLPKSDYETGQTGLKGEIMTIRKLTKAISGYKTLLTTALTALLIIITANSSVFASDMEVSVASSSISEISETTGDSRDSACSFFRNACDESSGNRELFYLAAIIQDPTNADYCWAYLEYLDEISAPSSDYYTLGSLVENAILNNSYTSVASLVDVYNYIVSECLTTTVADNSSSFEEERNASLSSLSADIEKLWTAASESLTYEEFSEMAADIEDEYNRLSDYVGSSVEEKYELLSSAKKILDELTATGLCIDRLAAMSDSDFRYSYGYVASGLDSAISSIVLIDTSSYGVFGTLVEEAGDKIKTGTAALDSRYDSLLLSDIYSSCRKTLNSITNRGTVSISGGSYYAVKAEYESIVSEYAAVQSCLRGTDEAVSISSDISDTLSEINTAIYKYQYERYQIWAASLLQTIKTKVEKAKNGEKLEILYREGYYTINTSYLIPKLQTLYSSLYDESYTKNSKKTDSDLLNTYGINVKSLGEV